MTEINVQSNERSYDFTTGSITTNGGIGVKKNIYVEEDIEADDIISRKNAKIGESLFVGNKIETSYVLPNSNSINSIGNVKQIWDYGYINNITSTNLDAKGEISLGANDKGEPLLSIDPELSNKIIVNSDVLFRGKNGDIFGKTIKDTKTIMFEHVSIGNSLSVPFRIWNVGPEFELVMEKMINIVNAFSETNTLYRLNIVLPDEENRSPDGSIFRIIVSCQPESTVILSVFGKELSLKDKDWVEFIKVNDGLLYIGGSL